MSCCVCGTEGKFKDDICVDCWVDIYVEGKHSRVIKRWKKVAENNKEIEQGD